MDSSPPPVSPLAAGTLRSKSSTAAVGGGTASASQDSAAQPPSNTSDKRSSNGGAAAPLTASSGGQSSTASKRPVSSIVPVTDSARRLLPIHFESDPGPDFTWWSDAEDAKIATVATLDDRRRLLLLEKYMDLVRLVVTGSSGGSGKKNSQSSSSASSACGAEGADGIKTAGSEGTLLTEDRVTKFRKISPLLGFSSLGRSLRKRLIRFGSLKSCTMSLKRRSPSADSRTLSAASRRKTPVSAANSNTQSTDRSQSTKSPTVDLFDVKDSKFIVGAKLCTDIQHKFTDDMIKSYLLSAQHRFEENCLEIQKLHSSGDGTAGPGGIPGGRTTQLHRRERISRSMSASSMIVRCMNGVCSQPASHATNFLCDDCFRHQKQMMESFSVVVKPPQQPSAGSSVGAAASTNADGRRDTCTTRCLPTAAAGLPGQEEMERVPCTIGGPGDRRGQPSSSPVVSSAATRASTLPINLRNAPPPTFEEDDEPELWKYPLIMEMDAGAWRRPSGPGAPAPSHSVLPGAFPSSLPESGCEKLSMLGGTQSSAAMGNTSTSSLVDVYPYGVRKMIPGSGNGPLLPPPPTTGYGDVPSYVHSPPRFYDNVNYDENGDKMIPCRNPNCDFLTSGLKDLCLSCRQVQPRGSYGDGPPSVHYGNMRRSSPGTTGGYRPGQGPVATSTPTSANCVPRIESSVH